MGWLHIVVTSGLKRTASLGGPCSFFGHLHVITIIVYIHSTHRTPIGYKTQVCSCYLSIIASRCPDCKFKIYTHNWTTSIQEAKYNIKMSITKTGFCILYTLSITEQNTSYYISLMKLHVFRKKNRGPFWISRMTEDV